MAYNTDIAELIVREGQRRGLGPREIISALSTGIVESGLRNLDYGHADSLGVFQQRPSAGWGSPAQVTDPEYATNAYYDRISQFDEGQPGWELAADIQRPARQYRDRYQQEWDEATQLYNQITGQGVQGAAAAEGIRQADAPGGGQDTLPEAPPVPGFDPGGPVELPSWQPDYQVPEYPTEPLPLTADQFNELFTRRREATRGLQEALIELQRGRQEANTSFQQFARQVGRDAEDRRDELGDEAAARNLAFQPAFTGIGKREIRNEAQARLARGQAKRAERVRALQDAVAQAQRERQETLAQNTRDRSRFRSDLDRLMGQR